MDKNVFGVPVILVLFIFAILTPLLGAQYVTFKEVHDTKVAFEKTLVKPTVVPTAVPTVEVTPSPTVGLKKVFVPVKISTPASATGSSVVK